MLLTVSDSRFVGAEVGLRICWRLGLDGNCYVTIKFALVSSVRARIKGSAPLGEVPVHVPLVGLSWAHSSGLESSSNLVLMKCFALTRLGGVYSMRSLRSSLHGVMKYSAPLRFYSSLSVVWQCRLSLYRRQPRTMGARVRKQAPSRRYDVAPQWLYQPGPVDMHCPTWQNLPYIHAVPLQLLPLSPLKPS